MSKEKMICELTKYYKDNIAFSAYKLANPEEKFKTLISNANEDCMRIALDQLRQKNISFSVSKGACFDVRRRLIMVDCGKNGDTATLFHEMAHAIDHIGAVSVKKQTRTSIEEKAFSNTVILSSNRTLDGAIRSEIKRNSSFIYEEMKRLFNDEVKDAIPKDTYDRYIYLSKLLNERKTLSRKLPAKRFLWGEKTPDFESIEKDPLLGISWESHFKTKEEAYIAFKRRRELNSIIDCKEINALSKTIRDVGSYKTFLSKYRVVLDMLNGAMKIDDELLFGHSYSYFKRDGNFGMEFFAECFSNVACSNTKAIEITRKFLPESLKAFDELYNVLLSNINE